MLKHAFMEELCQLRAQDLFAELQLKYWAHLQSLSIELPDKHGEPCALKALVVHLAMILFLDVEWLVVKYYHGVECLTVLQHVSAHLLHFLLSFQMNYLTQDVLLKLYLRPFGIAKAHLFDGVDA